MALVSLCYPIDAEPYAEGNSNGYTRWHQDHPQPDDLHSPSYRNVKLFVYIWDVPVGGGATAVVPGANRHMHSLPAERHGRKLCG